MGPLGWPFPSPSDAASDPAMASPPAPGHEDFKHLREVYFSVNPDYTGRFTVPVLWDKVTKRIVSNESSEIVRMFNSAFDGLVGEEYRAVDLYPEGLRGEVEEANAWQYDLINNGVYKSGFATTQEAYEKNVVALFEALDRAEEHLKTSPGPYWFGEKLTEVDVRLWVTIIRFDVSPPPPPSRPWCRGGTNWSSRCTCSTSSATSGTSGAGIRRCTSGCGTCTGTCRRSRRRRTSCTSRFVCSLTFGEEIMLTVDRTTTPSRTRRSTRCRLPPWGRCRISCRCKGSKAAGEGGC